MAWDWLPSVFKIHKIPARWFFLVLLTGIVILALPDSLAVKLGISPLISPYKGRITIITIVAFSAWVVQLFPLYQKWRFSQKYKAEVIEHLNTLSREEFDILAYCINRNRRQLLVEGATTLFNVLTGMKAKGLMTQASGMQSVFAIPFTMPSFVWEIIKEIPAFCVGDDKNSRMEELFREFDKKTSGYGPRL